ncbi:hypothetical protein FQZ97_792370 [compost metagenome]
MAVDKPIVCATGDNDVFNCPALFTLNKVVCPRQTGFAVKFPSLKSSSSCPNVSLTLRSSKKSKVFLIFGRYLIIYNLIKSIIK